MMKPIGLTYVEYEDGDLLGKVLAFLTLSPLAFLLCLFAISISKREMTLLYLSLGAILDTLLNVALKTIIAHERPDGERCTVLYACTG
jgi:dolichyldiphosphatase